MRAQGVFVWLFAAPALATGTVLARELAPFEYAASTDRALVHYTAVGDRQARATIALVDDCVAYVEARLPGGLEARVHVYVASSHAELEAVLGGAQDFLLEGVARSPQGAIVIRGRPAGPDLRGILVHELVHVALARHLAEGGLTPPVWLTEGLAELIADEAVPGDQTRQANTRTGGIIPLAELERDFPQDPVARNLAYAESRSFVAFVGGETGDPYLRRLIAAFARTADIEAAAQAAYGRSLGAFERAWAPRFSVNLRRVRVVNAEGGIFAAMTLLFVVAVTVRYWRRRAAEPDDEEGEPSHSEGASWVPPGPV